MLETRFEGDASVLLGMVGFFVEKDRLEVYGLLVRSGSLTSWVCQLGYHPKTSFERMDFKFAVP